MSEKRAPQTEPFFMVPKASADIIVKQVEGTDAAFCCAVFTALRWLANDARAPEGPLETTVALIAHRAGMGYVTAAKALKILESIGIIAVERRLIPGTKGRSPSLYTFPIIRGTFPAKAPPRRAERIKERKERKESLSGAAWPEGLPLEVAEALSSTYGRPVDRINSWYATWLAKKVEYGDPLPASPEAAFSRFKAAVHADRNRPRPKGQHSAGWVDLKPVPPKWATD